MATPEPSTAVPFWQKALFGGGSWDHGAGSWWADFGLLILRLQVGWTIAQAGYDKFPTEAWFNGQVAELGFTPPALFAFAAAFSEFAGGILLLLGLMTRPAALFIAFTMGVAAFGFHDLTPFFAIHIAHLYFFVFLMFTFVGGGRLSLDWLARHSRPLLALPVVAVLVVGLGIYANSKAAKPQTEATASDEVTSVALAGTFNDWDLTTNALKQQDAEAAVWSTTIDLPAGPAEFKLVANQDWDLALGESDQSTAGFPISGTAELGSDAGNVRIYVPNAGKYRFWVNSEDYSYRVEAIQDTLADEPAAEPQAD